MGTTNGGSTWTSQEPPAAVDGLFAVACPSTTVCEAGGYTGGSVQFGSSIMIGSTNGGATWTTQTLPSDIGNDISDIVCPSTMVCEAVATGYDGVDFDGFPDEGSILSTTDGGSTWAASTTPSDTGAISNIVCPSATVCELVGEASSEAAVIVGTTDSGATWTTQATLAETTQDFGGAGIACASATTCEAAAYGYEGGSLLGTNNGGATWTPQTLPSGVDNLYNLACPSTTVCEGVGEPVPIRPLS